MIAYTCFGTNDLPRAKAFYDQLFAAIGIKRIMEWGEQGAAWGPDFSQPMFGVLTPYNKEPATFGNGTMISILCKSEAEVQALYAKAIELGGKDEGGPGPRSEGFYAAYFRDLDGNKMNGFYMAPHQG
jgi:catechol 2,3-dioxygenase-like lactoylglutathione lyase family enzyme